MTETRARQLRKRWLIAVCVSLAVCGVLTFVDPGGDWFWLAYSTSVWAFCGVFKQNGYLQRADEPPFGLTPAERNTFAFYAWQAAYREISPRAITGNYHARAASALRWIAVAEQLAPDVEFTHKAWVQQTAERWLTEEE